MSDHHEDAIYEALTEICSILSLRPQYHQARVLLLTYPVGEWVDISKIIPAHSHLAEQLKTLTDKGVDLQAIHCETPDRMWSLVNFYCQLIDAMPATVLWLKSAHQDMMTH